jgi:putative FmdB family regulatory protein
MPIYEYRCGACGFQKEFLQKMSDAPLKDCPECGKPSLSKMVTAAGFQLKGSGWYATDFKHGPSKKAADKPAAKTDDKSSVKAETKPAAETTAKAADTTAPKATPAATPVAGS